MIILYTQQEYDAAKSDTLLKLECCQCQKPFEISKVLIKHYFKKSQDNKSHNKNGGNFCSRKCASDSQKTKQKINCPQCQKEFLIKPFLIKRASKNFCSKSCKGSWYAAHKKHGVNLRRSRLEKWIEEKLTNLYPDLLIKYNDRETIKAELDILIPSLNLAFELNGIFHYEPIFGEETLKRTQNNDNRRFQACLEHKIELCIIDTSKHCYMKEHLCMPFLDIITNIIDKKLK